MVLNATKLVLVMRLLIASLISAHHHFGVVYTTSYGISGR